MLKEQAKLFNKIATVLDTVVLVAAFLSAYNLRKMSIDLNQISWYAWMLVVVIPLWYYLLHRHGLYYSLRNKSPKQIVIELIKIHVIGGIVTACIIYLIVPTGFSRGLFVYFIILSFLFLSIEKYIVKTTLGHFRKRGYNTRYILVVGTNNKAEDFIRRIEEHANWGLKVIGLLKLSEEDPVLIVRGYKILGTIDDLVEICKGKTIDEVVFSVPIEALPDVEGYVLDMEEMGITVRMVLDFYDLKGAKKELSLFHNEIPILTFYSKAFKSDHLFLKRCLDIFGAGVGLIITALLFPFIALAIKLDSPGPLFFGQKRVGISGRTFTCWKFRSMYEDAEGRKNELLHLNEMNGAIFKIRDDPRITDVGRFLRKTSLDELPQFWNVLKGEMSLVGTRPPTLDEVAQYENWQQKRISIKPGITGLWQVSGRNQLQDFDEVARLDIEYIERWSLWLDINIILRTFWVVLTRRGSC